MDLGFLVKRYRARVERNLAPLVAEHYPAMLAGDRLEYRKMVELSCKMTIVGLACTQIAGYAFDGRRVRIASLFGACCFLGDSFLDDFGDETAREYLARLEILLTQGWFEIRNPREQLFYVIVARMFQERDVLDFVVRQSIVGMFLIQKKDVELRRGGGALAGATRATRLRLLRNCARDRGGHTISMLSAFLMPGLDFSYHSTVYAAGSLFMYIDDHGDCHNDRYHNRGTYMNQLKRPAATLRRIAASTIAQIERTLPVSDGRSLLVGFLRRYLITRLEKHRLERGRGISWTVYE